MIWRFQVSSAPVWIIGDLTWGAGSRNELLRFWDSKRDLGWGCQPQDRMCQMAQMLMRRLAKRDLLRSSLIFSLAGSSFQANFVNAKHLKFIWFVPSEQSHVQRNVEAIFVFADGLWWANGAQLSPIHANSTGPCQLERIYETSVFGRRITMIGNEHTMQ